MRRTSLCLIGLFLVVGWEATVRSEDAKQPFAEAKQLDLAGFLGIGRGSLTGKKLKDVVTDEPTSRVIVLANNTSAPNNIHLRHVARLMASNPTLGPRWAMDKSSALRANELDIPAPYFAVLLEGKSGRLTGLLFALHRTGEKEETLVKIVTKEGVGLIRLPSDGDCIPREIPAKVDRGFRPDPRFEYVLAGKRLFRTFEPGPASGETGRAWDLANEFVYRTSLAEQYALPAQWSGPLRAGIYAAGFKGKDDQAEIVVEVDLEKRTAKLRQW